MTRNKKILLGVGIAVVLGGVAFANFRFKRGADGITVNTETIQKRELEGHRLCVGQDPAEAVRSTSAPTRAGA